MDWNVFSSCSFTFSQEKLFPKRRRELMEKTVIASHHIQPVTGGFVGLVSSSLQF